MASLAEMLKEIDETNKSSSGSASAPERPNFYAESAKRGLTGMAAFNTAIAESVAPAMLTKLAESSIGKPSDLVKRLWERVLGSDPTLQPQTAAEKYGGKALEFAVAGGPFTAAHLRNAAMKIPAAASEIGSILFGSAGANVGGDIGEKYGSRGAGEAIGGLFGGITGAASPTLASKGFGLWQQVRPSSMDEIAQTVAGQQLRGALDATPGASQEIASSMDVARRVNQLTGQGDQFQPTLAQASGAPAVADIERSLAQRSIERHGEAIARQRQNESAIQAAKETVFPSGGSFARAAPSVVRGAEKQLDDRLAQIESAQASLESRIPSAQQQALGERLRDLRDDAFRVARGEKTQKYQSVYDAADAKNIQVDMTDIRDLVRSIKAADENAFADMPGTFGKVLRKYSGDDAVPQTGRSVDPEIVAMMQKDADKPVPFRELHSLMKDANSAYFAARKATDPKAAERAYFLGRLKDALSEKVKSFEGPEFGEVAEKLADANRFYQDKYRRAFRLGVGGELDAQQRFGERVLPEKVVDKFFTPSGMDDFYAVYGGNAEARQALSDGVLDLARKQVVRDGKISSTGMESFLRANDEALAKLPEVKSALKSVDSLNDALVARADRLTQGQSQIAHSTIARLAKTDNPVEVINQALSSRKSLLSLISAARSEPERRAVIRGIADAIPDAARKAGVTPIDYVIANEQVLAPALNRLGPRHIENLKLLAKAQTIQARSDVPAHAQVGKPVSAIEGATGTSGPSLLSQFRAAFITRQQGQHYVIASVLAKYGLKVRGEAVEKIQTQLVNNPELAQQMLRAATQRAPLKDTGNKLSDLLMSAGVRAFSASEQEGEGQTP